jgi:hypothetical protein
MGKLAGGIVLDLMARNSRDGQQPYGDSEAASRSRFRLSQSQRDYQVCKRDW